jgi:hypothetical protein
MKMFILAPGGWLRLFCELLAYTDGGSRCPNQRVVFGLELHG